jgi:hypothetical protein
LFDSLLEDLIGEINQRQIPITYDRHDGSDDIEIIFEFLDSDDTPSKVKSDFVDKVIDERISPKLND